MEISYIGHLDHEEHIALETLLHRPGQAPQMLGAPLRGGIGKGADALRFQCHTLHFQEAPPAVFQKTKIVTGIAMGILRFQIGNVPKPSGKEPFPGGDVGSLGVHVDQPLALADGDKIEFGLPAGIVGHLAPDLCTDGQQLPATAGVFYVDHLHLSADFHMGDESIEPGKKPPGHHIGILHLTLP